jgi:SAM-dependent methyltransferase
MTTASPATEAVIWHDVECGAYGEDLPLWEELAGEAGGAILDLGAGTGRVAIHLARRGHRVLAVDIDPVLVAELERRAVAESLELEAACADLRQLVLGGRNAALAIAPMQTYQLLGDADERVTALGAIGEALAPGAVVALAIVEGDAEAVGDAGPDVVPDVRESDGWLYSSLPLEVVAREGHLEILRLRQTVSPQGNLSEATHIDRLAILSAATVEAEARSAGLGPAGRREIHASDLHVGSTVVLLRKEA